jgi:tetratricopeptide (TPR) repeat protein
MNHPSPLEAIFFAALEKSTPTERAAYLHAACAGDPDLRGRVEKMVAAQAQAGSFLEQPARSPVVTVDEPITERPGTVIGPYKLMEQIGEGGMGLVFVAEQQHPVRRKVALKVIKPGMDTRQVVARFEAERQALALMDHPNIAHVHDGGTTPAGHPYFVMELVKGVPITAYCDQNQVPVRERLALFLHVCQAVQHAHQKGIIHRDLKPSNVLVASHDGKPVVKVIDFGVAKAIGQQLTDKTVYTQLSQLVGTPLYMSPEQAGESSLDIDTRSDIYALGVLLYELLTGTTPFAKERFQGAGYEEIRRIIREEEPPRPSTRISTLGQAAPTVSAQRQSDPKRLSTLLRGELDWIVMKALEKDRNRRYETASAFAADVQRYLHDEPVQACPPSAWYRLRKFARRNRAKLSVAVGMFLAVTVIAGTIGWAVRDRMAREEESERAETTRRAQVAGRVREAWNAARTLIGENKVAAARQKLAEARGQLGNDRSALGDLAAEVEAGEAELNRYQQFLDLIDRAHQAETAPVLEAALPAKGSLGHSGTPPPARGLDRQPAAAVPFLLQALKRYEVLERDGWNSTLGGGLLGRDQVQHIGRVAYEELLWLADDVVGRQQEHRSGRKLSPQAAARAALGYLGKAENAHRPTLALYVQRARCRKALGEKAAAQADRRLAAETPPTMALDHFLRGQAAYDAKQLPDAVQAFESALRLEPTHYWSMMQLGACLCDLGQGKEDFAGATRVFSGCILKRPDHAHAYYYRANAYLKLRRHEVAVADFSKAIQLDPKHTAAWINRGVAYDDLGQWAKAAADYSKAIELEPKLAVPAWINRGYAYVKLGQPAKAVADCSKAIELDPNYARAWNSRGRVYRDLDQPAKAVADLSKAIELDPKLTLAWNNRGIAYLNLGQPAKALADFSKAIELDRKFAFAWNNRGNAYRNLGQPAKAVADYSKAIDMDPKSAGTWNNRGNAYLDLGQPAKAVADYSKAIELDPKLVPAWNGRGIAYYNLGQPANAVADSSKAIELDSKFAEAWGNRGNANFTLGQLDKAVADYSKAIELDPKLTLAWNNRGIAYLNLGQPAKAVADCSKAIQLDPKFANAWYSRGYAYLKLDQPAKALGDYSKVINLDPKFADAWCSRGQAYLKLGQPAKAVADCSTAIELRKGGDAFDWLYLAMAHRKLGNHDQARNAYDQAVQWLKKNQEALAKDQTRAEELRRLRSEAETVLELKKK